MALERERKASAILDRAYDVIVIGARVAGATVAALLGDAGYRVLLVDRVSFPSATLSTHFFRGAGLLAVLSRLRLLDYVLALDAPPLLHCYFYSEATDLPVTDSAQAQGEHPISSAFFFVSSFPADAL